MDHKLVVNFKRFIFYFYACLSCCVPAFASSKDNVATNKSGNYAISYTCIANKCKFFIGTKDGGNTALLLDVAARSPSVSWLNNNLAQIVLSCGSNCHISYFYHTEKGISSALQEVLAVKPDEMCVLVAGVEGLSVFKIFDSKNKVLINYSDKKLNFNKNRAVMYLGVNATFFKNGDLILNYLDAENKKAKMIYKGACL